MYFYNPTGEMKKKCKKVVLHGGKYQKNVHVYDKEHVMQLLLFNVDYNDTEAP